MEESISLVICFPTGGVYRFLCRCPISSGMTCQDVNDGLPGEIEDDVTRDACAVHFLDVGCECLSDACVLR